MKTKINKYIGVLAIIATLTANLGVTMADDFEDGALTLEAEVSAEPEVITESAPEVEAEPDLTEQHEFLNRLKNELQISKIDYRQVIKNTVDTRERLAIVNEERTTLTGQLENIDMMIENTEFRLIKIIQQILEKENEMVLIDEQIAEKEVIFEYQKELLRDYLRVMYMEENNYDPYSLLLADGSVGGYIQELKYLDMLNQTAQQLLDRLDQLSVELELERASMSRARASLHELRTSVEREKEQLEIQRFAKENLLKLTTGQEEIYAELLSQSELEREEVLGAVKNFSDAIAFIEEKIAIEGEDFDPEEYMDLLDYRTQAVYRLRAALDYKSVDGFVWPADPTRGISAYFRDPSYVAVFGVGHNAIDIPIYQRSPIRSAADGVVYVARDNGYGYSYIIVAHSSGFMTVYGHMNEILVEEGQIIPAGFVIGLSGGMPGTKGAGYMTTGPHLHFEILHNGIHVDPLDYLNLGALTQELVQVLPARYQEKWLRDTAEPVLRDANAPEEVLDIEDAKKIFRGEVVESSS